MLLDKLNEPPMTFQTNLILTAIVSNTFQLAVSLVLEHHSELTEFSLKYLYPRIISRCVLSHGPMFLFHQ